VANANDHDDEHGIADAGDDSEVKAARSISILDAMPLHHVGERDGRATSGSQVLQPALGEVDVLEIVEVFQERFANVIALGPAREFGEPGEPLLDGRGKANGEHDLAPVIRV
jgi:hypothetical protein